MNYDEHGKQKLFHFLIIQHYLFSQYGLLYSGLLWLTGQENIIFLLEMGSGCEGYQRKSLFKNIYFYSVSLENVIWQA